MSCGGGSGGGSGGGTTNTITQTQAPNPAVQQAYSNLTNSAFGVAGQPLQQYAGPLVAGFTPQQTQAFQEIQNSQGIGTPYINAAAQEFGQATTPFYQNVGQYQSPYTGQVTNALQGLFNQQNAEQQQQVNSNATAQNAFGGDRGAVANALTAKQQNLSEAPTMANVLQGGYQTALGATEAQGWLGEQGGFGLGSLGTEAQNAALTGASAELGAGGMQQQLAQEQLNIPYEQFQSAQAYPWQVLGNLSPIVSGTGSLSGGTGSTTYPGPSLVSQLGGLGIAGLGTYGLLKNTGALSALGIGGGSAADAAAAADAVWGADALGAIGGAAGGANALGAIGGAALLAKSGGRAGFADGGGIGGEPSSLPTVPTINLDYLVHPGPLSKGSGPPRAPQGNPEQFQGMSPTQELQMFSGLDKMVNQAGIGGDGSAIGGRQHRQDGGTNEAGLGAMETTGAPLAGLPPNAQGFVQKLQTLPMDQLQAIAARTPPSSPYGAMIQRVLTSRRITPSAAPNQVSSASGVPIGTGIGQVPGIGGSQQQQQPQQQLGMGQNPQQGYAAGGGPVIEEEPDMDPHPVVDHSGKTVVVRYPSEGKELDLGIPSSPGRRTLATGGAGASPAFTNSITAANGISLPQLSTGAFSAPYGNDLSAMSPSPGGGLQNALGDWFNPMQQYKPPGGTLDWPTFQPQFNPGMSILQDFFGPGSAYKEGGRLGFQAGDDVPNVEVSPDSPFASGNGFGSPDLGPPAAIVTPAGSVVTPTQEPTSAPTPTAAPTPSPTQTEPAPTPKSDAGNKYDAQVRAHGETPQEDTAPAGGAPSPPKTDPLDAVMAHIAQPESGGRDVLYGGAPVPPGNVIPGAIGPTGQPTHAFDKYQFEPDTWNAANTAARAQGRVLDKDNPQDVEWAGRYTARNSYGIDQTGHNLDQAAAAGTVDYSRLAHTWPSLAPHRASGPPDQIVGGRGALGTADNPYANVGFRVAPDQGGIGEPYGGIGGAALQPPRTAPSAEWSQSPWMIPIAIGAGMMSGRSAHPLVNVGQGLAAGVKTAETQGEQGTRAAALENEAANRQATLGIEAQRLHQTGQYQTGELAARQNEFQRQTKAEQDRFNVEMLNAKTANARADVMDRHYENMDAINAGYKQMMMAKPLPGFEKDQNGNIVYGVHEFNPETGHFEFKPGAGEGRPVGQGGQQAIYDRLIQSGAAKDEADAVKVLAAAKANPDAFKRSATYTGLVEREEGSLRNTMIGKPDAEIQAEAQRRVDQLLASQGTQAHPSASAAAPAAPAWTAEHPLVPKTQADIDSAPPGSVIQTPHGPMVKPYPQQQPAP